jgi:hypothetical protein
MESIRDAVIAERWSWSRSVSDAMMRTIPKSIKARLAIKVVPPALTAAVDVRNESPTTIYMYAPILNPSFTHKHTLYPSTSQMFAPEKISWRPQHLILRGEGSDNSQTRFHHFTAHSTRSLEI